MEHREGCLPVGEQSDLDISGGLQPARQIVVLVIVVRLHHEWVFADRPPNLASLAPSDPVPIVHFEFPITPAIGTLAEAQSDSRNPNLSGISIHVVFLSCSRVGVYRANSTVVSPVVV
jgi:hypothetical protein